MMRRRDLLAMAAGAAAAASGLAQAEPAATPMRRVGALMPLATIDPQAAPCTAAFERGLA
jgi:hypothetical protein